MKRTAPSVRALFALFAAIVTGCAGGGASLSQPPVSLATSAPAAGSKAASVAFTMHWTTASPTAASHRTYVPSTAQSVTVSVNGGQTQYLNNPATQLTIAAPAGVDNFAFATYDEQNGEGNVLSSATVTQTVLAGTGNFVSATLNAVIASIGVSLANAALPAGAAATTAVSVSALDADGNVIVGPGDYDTPIHLAIDDPTSSGTLSLSTNLVETPGTPATITLNYNGGTLTSGLAGAPLATVVASASGLPSASIAFTPTPTFYAVAEVINSVTRQGGDVGGVAAGPDGNMWVTDSYNDAVDKVTPAGVITTYLLGNGGFEPGAIIGASDGNLWFTEAPNSSGTPGHIGFVTPAGAVTEYNTVGSYPGALVDGENGAIFYVDAATGIGEQYIYASSATLTDTTDQNAVGAAICLGPDHALYYTGSNFIGKTNPYNFGATPTKLVLPSADGGEAGGVVRGPDNNIWVADAARSEIDIVSPTTFAITKSFPTLTPSEPRKIVVGKDGALWFLSGNKLSRVTTSGTMTDFVSGGGSSLAVAQDGSIWIGGSNSSTLQKLVY